MTRSLTAQEMKPARPLGLLMALTLKSVRMTRLIILDALDLDALNLCLAPIVGVSPRPGRGEAAIKRQSRRSRSRSRSRSRWEEVDQTSGSAPPATLPADHQPAGSLESQAGATGPAAAQPP